MKYLITLILISNIACAEETASKEEVNYCLDPETAQENEKQARSKPDDKVLSKLIALRTGLCDLVDKNIITVREATDIFEVERVKSMTKRWKEEIENSTEISL